jgi:hypothetical protein
MKFLLEDSGYDTVDTFLPGIPALKKDVSVTRGMGVRGYDRYESMRGNEAWLTCSCLAYLPSKGFQV